MDTNGKTGMDIKQLLDTAKSGDGLGEGKLDTFLRINHYDESDTSERITIDDLYAYYSEYHYNIHKELPNRHNFSDGSNVFIANKIRQRKQLDKTKLTWGLKCSKLFKETFNQWHQNSVKWRTKLKRILSGQKRKLKKQNQSQLLDTKPSP